MDTYTPMRAMIVCANGTGDYIKKEDAIKALQNIFKEDSSKIIEAFLKEFSSVLTLYSDSIYFP